MSIFNVIKSGIGFGLTSGIITTVGLIVGLYTLNASSIMFIGGILTIAISDSISDSFGMNVAQRTTCHASFKDGLLAFVATLITKAFISVSFIMPFILFTTGYAVLFSLLWTAILTIILSIYLSKTNGQTIPRTLLINALIVIIAIAAVYFTQQWIHSLIL
jgi:vacuolar iron transporter family protein